MAIVTLVLFAPMALGQFMLPVVFLIQPKTLRYWWLVLPHVVAAMCYVRALAEIQNTGPLAKK